MGNLPTVRVSQIGPEEGSKWDVEQALEYLTSGEDEEGENLPKGHLEVWENRV